MMAQATIALAAQSAKLTLVARTSESLSAVRDEIDGDRIEVRSLQLDWNLPGPFLESLREHVRSFGVPDLILCWLHDDNLAVDLAEATVPPSERSRMVHIRSSRVHDPSRSFDSAGSRLAAWPCLVYQQVILGFVINQNSSRWLTHAEIVAGALAAVNNPGRSVVIVGTASPWSMRP